MKGWGDGEMGRQEDEERRGRDGGGTERRRDGRTRGERGEREE